MMMTPAPQAVSVATYMNPGRCFPSWCFHLKKMNRWQQSCSLRSSAASCCCPNGSCTSRRHYDYSRPYQRFPQPAETCGVKQKRHRCLIDSTRSLSSSSLVTTVAPTTRPRHSEVPNLKGAGQSRKSITSRLQVAPHVQAFLEGSSSLYRRQSLTSSWTTSPLQALSSLQASASSSSSSEPNWTRTTIRRMKVADLRQALSTRELDTSGTKETLVERLISAVLGNKRSRSTSRQDKSATLVPEPLTASFDDNNNLPEMELHKAPVLDPGKTYVLQAKGFSTIASEGTGFGIVLYEATEQPTTQRWMTRMYLFGNRSTFEAEYSAMILGIRYAIRHGARKLIIRSDHDVVNKQLLGTYIVRKDRLKPLYWQIMKFKENELESLQFDYVPSLGDDTAVSLAKKAMATGKSFDFDNFEPMGENYRGRLQQGEEDEEEEGEDDRTSANESTELANTFMVTAATSRTRSDKVIAKIDPNITYLLQFDGGSRGNPPFKSGAGMVLYDDSGEEIWCGWKYLDAMSNNMAEYHAILLGLKCARSLGIKSIRVQGDSELIIQQIKGAYRVRDAKLRQMFELTKPIVNAFESLDIHHIPRAENKRADWLANHAMDTGESHGFDEMVESGAQ